MTEFNLPVRVYYEDTDAGGVVYYANYLKFMERARTEYLRALGFEQDQLAAQEKVLFVVRSAQVDYLRPARFNDQLLVSVAIAELRKASISFVQNVVMKDDPLQILTTAKISVACVDRDSFRPQAIPLSLKQAVNIGH